MRNAEYTTKDSLGIEIKKGDQVSIAFTGEVRSVTRDGLVIVRTPDGTITAFYPSYQRMQKLDPSITEVLSSKNDQ